MKFIVSAVAFCCLLLTVVLAQMTPPLSLQPTPLEAFAHQPTTRVTWSMQVGSLDSREAHAVITALVLEDTAQPPDRMRGIRINLSSPDSTDEVYLGEETLAVYKTALDEISRAMASSRNGTQGNLAPGGTSCLGACVFRSDKPSRVHSLTAAYCFAPDYEGLSLSTFKQVGFRFPDQDPSRFSAAIGVAIDQLKNH